MFFSSVLVFFSFFLSNFSTSDRSGLSHILPTRPPRFVSAEHRVGGGEVGTQHRGDKGRPGAPPHARFPPRTIAQGGARRHPAPTGRPPHDRAPRPEGNPGAPPELQR